MEQEKKVAEEVQLDELNLDIPIKHEELDSYEFGKGFRDDYRCPVCGQLDKIVKNICGHYICEKCESQQGVLL